ncbi:MAG: MopE-related protein [Patescibacteria group bacterium]
MKKMMRHLTAISIFMIFGCAFPEEKTMSEIFVIDLGNDVKVSKDEIFEGEDVSNDVDVEAEDLNDAKIEEEEISCLPTDPPDEICDEIDNDCDGKTDEDFDLKNDVENCGKCGNDCLALANVADVTCANGFCFITDCQENYFDVNEQADDGCECEKTSDQEICDQIDNNCNGEIDEDLSGCCEPGAEQDCGFNDLGECKLGKKVCLEDSSWSDICQGAVFPEDELCDDKDNDCNGKTDETFNLGAACEVGVGECLNFGKTICSENGKDVVCNVNPKVPQKEICDNKDNNCDGKTDEDWPELGNECEVGKGECKNSGKMVCKVPALSGVDATICDAIPFEPTDETCDYLDNDCNDFTDEKFPELGTNCSVGKGECKKEGIFVCNLETGFSKCSVEPGEPQDEICDLKDNNCDDITDNVNPELLKSDFDNCGECFKSCSAGLPNAKSVACQESKCTPTECVAKFWNADKIPENGCECQISSGAVEICDSKDNDCDGATDELCDNLVLYLPFDGDWLDKSKYGNNATPYNGAGFTSDAILGQAANFDGLDDYAVVADSASMDSIGEEFTWMIMIKALDIAGIKSIIFNKMSSMPALLAIWSDKNPCPLTDCFCFRVDGSNVTCQPVVELNKWYQFVARYKKGEFTIYLNNNQLWQGMAPYPQNVGSILEISGDAGIGIAAVVDEFIFYSKALSDEEIANYYEKIK